MVFAAFIASGNIMISRFMVLSLGFRNEEESVQDHHIKLSPLFLYHEV